MASRSQDDLSDPNADPYQQLRNRVLAQQQSADPTTDTGAAGDSGSQAQQNPISSADFQTPDTGVQQSANINTTQPVASPATTGSDTTTVGGWTATTAPGYTRNPDGTITGPGGVSFSNTGQRTAPAATTGSAQAYLQSLLGSGVDPNTAISRVNTQYGLGYGNSAVYYPAGAHGPGSGAVIGLAGIGGYYAQQSDGSWQFVPSAEQSGADGQPQGGAATTLAPSPAPSLASYGLTVPQGLWSPDFMNQLRSLLMDRLSAASQPVSGTDPNIMTAVNAARDQAQRQSDLERTQAAERLYAQGNLNSNALNQTIQQSNERTATSLGTLRANLIMNEVQQRRGELQSLLQLALSAGDADMARQVQAQITALNAQLQEENMANNLAINSAYLNQNAALAGLRG